MSLQTIVLAGGCFWCLDASYRLINGVTDVVSGYTGGAEKNPSYYEVGSGATGHAEAVSVTFDSEIISLEDILDIFWAMHDPTTLNRQGADRGPQYRSAIFYKNESQKLIAEKSRDTAQKLWPDPIVTEIQQCGTFYTAEDYHQDYFAKNPEQAYCQVIINPKLAKIREKFSRQLR